MSTKSVDVVLLIDADNISAKFADKIINRAKSFGNLRYRLAYAQKDKLKRWNRTTHKLQTQIAALGKNRADNMIKRQSLKIIEKYPSIDIFCLVSNDRHFAKIAEQIRQSGKRVIIVGTTGASRLLTKDQEFVCIEKSL